MVGITTLNHQKDALLTAVPQRLATFEVVQQRCGATL